MIASALFACASLSALAAEDGTREMNVAGEITIDAQGKVKDVKVYDGAVPAVGALVQRAIKHWTFEPVMRNGTAVEARTGFWVGVRATPVDNGYATRIARVSFRNVRRLIVRSVMQPPSDVLLYRQNAEALAALRADGTGRITDVVVIGLQSPEGRLLTGRQAMSYERYVVAMIRKWKFEPAGPGAGEADEVDGLLPISINMSGKRENASPWVNLKPVPWRATQSAPDTSQLQDGAIAATDDRIHLRNEVIGTTL